MDFKGFKKVGSDDKSTTFKHPNGSWLKVAHKGLSKGNIDKLKNLPQHPAPDLKALSKAPVQYAEANQADLRSGNQLVPEGFASGGEVGDQDSDVFARNSAAISRNMVGQGPEFIPDDESDGLTGDDVETLERGDSIQDTPVPDSPVQSEDIPPDDAGRGPASTGAPMAIPAAPQVAMPPTPDIPPENSSDVQTPGGATYGAPSGGANDPFAQANNVALRGLGEEKQGATQSAIATGELGAREAAADSMAANSLNDLNAKFNDTFGKYQADRQLMYKNWLEHGAIDPQRFVRNMSTGDKISTAIGLIFGGMGAGLSHQPNLAAEFLQKQIDNDILAQRVNLDNRQSLLKFNLDATGDLFKATELTRGQIMDINSMHLKALAARAADPMARAQLLTTAGQIDQKASQVYQNIAMREAMLQAGNQGGEQGFQARNRLLRVMGPDTAKFADEAEKHHVSGVGDASVDVPDDVRTQIQTRNSLDTSIRDLANFARQNSGSLNPATIAQGKAKAALVQDMMRQAQNAGVFKESEKDFMNKYIGEDPTQFFERFRAGKGYEEVRKNNLINLNNLKKVYGLPVTQEETAATQGAPNIQYRLENGQRIGYQKVPGGWKRLK